jgi:hypothetical protein
MEQKIVFPKWSSAPKARSKLDHLRDSYAEILKLREQIRLAQNSSEVSEVAVKRPPSA